MGWWICEGAKQLAGLGLGESALTLHQTPPRPSPCQGRETSAAARVEQAAVAAGAVAQAGEGAVAATAALGRFVEGA